MKKTIVISIVTSAMLFGATVDNLSTDQVNKVTDSTLNNVTATQGKTSITGSADVDDLTIIQKDADSGDTGNSINSVTVNGTSSADLNINQGSTTISDATVNNVTIDSDSKIDGGTIDGSGEVSQGAVSVGGSGSVLENVQVHSTNTMTNLDIDGSTNRPVIVSQGTLVVSGDANVSDAEADDIDIQSTNDIQTEIKIQDSTVRQSYIAIDGSGTTAKNLQINQTNTLSGSTSITSDSTTLQGVVKIDTGADVNGLSSTVTNTIDGLTSINSTTVQNHINIHTDSTVTNLTVNTGGTNNNTIDEVSTTDSTVTQNTYNITNGSSVTGLTGTHDNIISNSTLTDAHIYQDALDINGSTINSDATIKSTNKIDDVVMTGSSNSINQAITVINQATLTSPSLISNNEVSGVDLDDSEVTQSYTSIVNTTSVTGLDLDNTNKVTNTDASGDINSSTVIQAEFMMNGGSVSTLTQDTENTINNSEITGGSTIKQANIALGDSDVTNVTLGKNGDITNDITSDIDNSNISQNGLRICGSTVTGLDVDQDNDITGGSITGSTVSQGDINIEGADADCETLARAEMGSKEY